MAHVPRAHVFPGTVAERNAALLKRAQEAYEAGTLDAEYLEIAADFGVSPHDAYSAAFGYLPFTGGKAA